MKNSFIVFLIFTLVACGPEKTVQIKGKLDGSNAEMIYLKELGGNPKTSVNDSILVNEKGNFLFSHKISCPTFYSLTINTGIINILAHPGDKITISGDAQHLSATYDVEGNEDSKYIRRLSQKLNQTIHIGDSLNTMLQSFTGNRNFVNIQRQLEWTYINEVDSLRAYNIRFINNNPGSLVVVYALYQQLSPTSYLFNREEDIKYFRLADSLFYKNYSNVSFVKSLHANVVEMNEKYRVKEFNRMLSMLGHYAPDIALPAPNGQIVKLSAGKGKIVLLDFWASWSAPCREENIHLLKIYDTFRDRGFEVYQVSLDQSKSSWERAIKEDGLPWINVSDLKYWDSEVVRKYEVETIPANFLIDKEGTIIAKDLKGDALAAKLSEIFVETK